MIVTIGIASMLASFILSFIIAVICGLLIVNNRPYMAAALVVAYLTTCLSILIYALS